MLSSRGSSRPRDRTDISFTSPALAGGFFTSIASLKGVDNPQRRIRESEEGKK